MRQCSTFAAAALMLSLLGGCQNQQAGPSDKPLPLVKIATPVQNQIVEWDAYTGRLEAVDFVEVRARVSGYLESIYFDEGQLVEQGQLLFLIDPRPFKAELEGAKAALRQAESQLLQSKAQLEEAQAVSLRSEAQLSLAEAKFARAKQLNKQNALSQEERDQREAEFLQAQADVEGSKAGISSAKAAIATSEAAVAAAEAHVDASELDLAYTKIRAPVSGRISQKGVAEGNLVNGGTATSTLLTTITSVEPIYCKFEANEQQVLKYMRLALSGKRESSRVAKNPVYLGLVDESGFPHQGHMDFVDNRFDSATASMRARAVFLNPDQLLFPGMFARIRIPGSDPYTAVLIPDSAVGTDQSSQYVTIVVNDEVIEHDKDIEHRGEIERRSVVLGPIVDGLRVVREGLSGDEMLVVEGLLQARPGSKVRFEKKKDGIQVVEDGLPDNYEPVSEEEWLSPQPDTIPPETERLLQEGSEQSEKSGDPA